MFIALYCSAPPSPCFSSDDPEEKPRGTFSSLSLSLSQSSPTSKNLNFVLEFWIHEYNFCCKLKQLRISHLELRVLVSPLFMVPMCQFFGCFLLPRWGWKHCILSPINTYFNYSFPSCCCPGPSQPQQRQEKASLLSPHPVNKCWHWDFFGSLEAALPSPPSLPEATLFCLGGGREEQENLFWYTPDTVPSAKSFFFTGPGEFPATQKHPERDVASRFCFEVCSLFFPEK